MEFWHAIFSHRNLYYNLGLVYSFTHLEYILVCFLNFWKTKGAVSNPFFCVKLLCNCVISSYFLLKVLSVHAIINMCMMISLLIIAFTDILITQIHYNSGYQILRCWCFCNRSIYMTEHFSHLHGAEGPPAREASMPAPQGPRRRARSGSNF